MSTIITLQNDHLTVDISTRGAEILSVRSARGTEFIWEGDPAVWAGHAPIMFPICGGLKEDSYFLNGRQYQQQKHGYIRFEEFTPVRVSACEAVLAATHNEETLKTFPWQYTFTASFCLEGDGLAVTYAVENRDSSTMYFSVGGHEAYATPEGVDAYEIAFEKDEQLAVNSLHGNLLGHDRHPIASCRVLPLNKEFFAVDALIFEELCSRAVTLRHKDGRRAVRVEFPGFDHLLLWQKYDAPYLCVEPWTGMPDFIDSDNDITHKPYITALEAGKSYAVTHTITFTEGE